MPLIDSAVIAAAAAAAAASTAAAAAVKQNAMNNNEKIPPSSSPISVSKFYPIINVIDTENDNICMCSSSSDIIGADAAVVNDGKLIAAATESLTNEMIKTICTVCQNTIKSQPSKPRKTLISKRLALANNIIVNRVDTHYLNLNSYPLQYPDSYTPESVESHSPNPEQSELDIDGKIESGSDTDEINQNIDLLDCNNVESSTMIKQSQPMVAPTSQAVSPRQLTSRLRNLTKSDSIMAEKSRNRGDGGGGGDVTGEKLGCIERYCELL